MNHAVIQTVLFGVLASFLNATTAALVKWVGLGVPTTEILFTRFGVGVIFILLWLAWRGERPLRSETYQTGNIKLHFWRAVFGLASFGCLFYALVHIPMVDAILLNVTHPLFVPFIVTLFLGVPFVHRLWPGIVVGLAGVVIVLQPGLEVFQSKSIIGLASGVFSAAAMVITRRLNHTEPVHLTLFYYFVFSLLMLSCVLPFTWAPISMRDLGLLFVISIVSVMYQLAFVTTLRYAPARVVTPIFYLTIVFGGFYDWLGWGTVPPLHVWTGSLLVFAGATLTLIAGRQLVQRVADQPSRA